MKDYKVGLGFDVHKITKKRKGIILAGVKVPCSFGLKAVSDGDVLLHAAADALCGAAGLGDIGDYFSPKDPKSKNIDSKEIIKFLLKKVNKKYKITNIDTIIVAQKPKLLPFKKKIVDSLKKILSTKAVNVKIKSKEGLDILGGKTSIAVMALAIIKRI